MTARVQAFRKPAPVPGTARPLLRVEKLVKHFAVKTGFFGRKKGAVKAVDGVDF